MGDTQAKAVQSSVMAAMIPIMFCFFSMGFIDLCGVCANQIKSEFQLTNAQADLIPTLTFVWFFIVAVPVSLLMNKIGRKNTVIVSMIITCVAMAAPIFTGTYAGIIVAFSLVGIGNVFLQTSLNPLVSNVISPQHLASTLTFGQFIKAFVGISGPIILVWCFNSVLPNFGLSWRAMFPYYGIIGIIATILIARVSIHEEKPDKVSGFIECLRLLGDGFVLCCFLAIICHVGIDVGTNSTAPRFLAEVLGVELKECLYAVTIYFVARMISCFLGAILLRVMSPKLFFLCGSIFVAVGLILLWASPSEYLVYTAIILIALGNSNLFSVAFSQALNRRPTEGNEVSGLMIMGVAGGAIIPPAMGLSSDILGSQSGAVLVLCCACAYFFFYTILIKPVTSQQ